MKALVACWACTALMALPYSMESAVAQEARANIALGKTVTALPMPNSPDSGNKLESLTDGAILQQPVVSQGTTSLWVQPTAVGWARTPVTCLVVDLESSRPVTGFSYHTAAGVADVTWPDAIHMLISDDRKSWRYAGNLVRLSDKENPAPAYGKYHEHTFIARGLNFKARYVAFGVTSSLYTITDEIEVFGGDTAANTPDSGLTFAGQPEDLNQFVGLLVVNDRIDRRVDNDLGAIRKSIAGSRLDETKKNKLLIAVATAGAWKAAAALPGEDFRTILPINARHRAVLSVRGEFLAAQGMAPLTVWNRQRYEWIDLLAQPSPDEKPKLSWSMLGNQFRAQSLLLTNASGAEQKVKLRLAKAPAGARPGWLQVDEVLWTDTFPGAPVSDALKPTPLAGGTYTVTVPAGMTRKVWLTVDSSKLAPGSHSTQLMVESGAIRNAVPFNCRVSTLAMKRPRISLGMWDETDGIENRSSYSLNAKNYPDALRLMQSHYVDTVWGRRESLPWPGAEAFDEAGQLKAELDFSAFDKWVADWPEARRFLVFLHPDGNFAGAAMGSEQFNARVGSWAKAILAHLKKTGRDPKQVGFLIVDEPQSDAADNIIAAWSDAINAVAPELTLFSDPLWPRPGQAAIQKALTNMDILSPNLAYYQRGGEEAWKHYEELRRGGRELWFYQCDGPTRLFDPQRYFRYQAWHTFRVGGTGQGFWSFGDGGRSSWNEYAGINFTYAPAFVDPTSVTNSTHWDAVREGMTDYEELAMLRDAIAASKNAVLKQEAQRVLDGAVKAVTGTWKDKETTHVNVGVTAHYDWRRPDYDADLADRELLKVRAMLERLS